MSSHPNQGAAPSAPIPKDLETINNILKDMGVQSFDPRVPDQLLEFIHTYTVNVLKDAQIFQAHRSGQKVEIEDLRLAIQSRVNNSFTQPPPRELMLELAADRNSQPLNPVPKRFGVLLPPESMVLGNANYQLGDVAKADDGATRKAE